MGDTAFIMFESYSLSKRGTNINVNSQIKFVLRMVFRRNIIICIEGFFSLTATVIYHVVTGN